ncbi:PX-domain protein (macronuclear) [Tetrahymena thermophila SB210]|uniref:PX-domain protein n=1 Tax=Tetrahymena thermophila (strain SB210) TaxID=312017 RepID=I7MJ39_TETTS|nr:PX-domain protein [Tetrahymena thermophila SB210]EAR95781.2 PX-domain protein [Tetrahymena thermophila SB210]|eukprot:XP_001016026.2 PX-domain protein [Tetrahymena thermophila SB210]
MDNADLKFLNFQDNSDGSKNKIQLQNDKLQANLEKFYNEQINDNDEDREDNQKNDIFNCEIEFPEEWTQVEIIDIQNGLNIDWIKQEQKGLCKQYLLCQKCKNILWNPKKCKTCKKHSCLKCFESVQRCSFCPIAASNSLIIKEPEEFCVGLLKDLQVYCPFQKRGCKSLVEYKLFEQHVNECNFRRDDQNIKFKQILIGSFRYKQMQALQKSYVLYSIETHIKDMKKVFKVERRYKQFEILHQYFSSKPEYFGQPLPSLPPKQFCLQSLLGTQSDQMSEEEVAQIRMIELEAYLQIIGVYYKDDIVLYDFLTNEEGFNYINKSSKNVWNLEYLISQYNSIKFISSFYIENLLSKGFNSQTSSSQEQQNKIKKSQALQDQYELLCKYKLCFTELRKSLISQISNTKHEIEEIEKGLQKLNEYSNESLLNEFLKRIQEELVIRKGQLIQMDKTMKQLSILQKYIESIDNCENLFQKRANEYQILSRALLEFQLQDKNYKEIKECKDIMQSMEVIEQESKKYHSIGETESKKILEKVEKDLPIVLKSLKECYSNVQA